MLFGWSDAASNVGSTATNIDGVPTPGEHEMYIDHLQQVHKAYSCLSPLVT